MEKEKAHQSTMHIEDVAENVRAEILAVYPKHSLHYLASHYHITQESIRDFLDAQNVLKKPGKYPRKRH